MSAMAKEGHKSTAAACSRQTCEGCEIQGKLLCLHTTKDLLDSAVLAVGVAIPCYHLSCPVNRVPEEVRQGFFKNYPGFARAWGQGER
ncbi:MAG: hypothetical protein JSV36_07025 [Anaerolineae bacterium]|nr:MAG: hypothetical protein JSV36_07025 [Anaerolineae bacterium]